jgi:hypothetical protein
MELNEQLRVTVALSQEYSPCCALVSRLEGPKTGLDDFENKKKSAINRNMVYYMM